MLFMLYSSLLIGCLTKYLSSSKTKGSTGSKGMASTSRIIPARISKDLTEEITETSKKVFNRGRTG